MNAQLASHPNVAASLAGGATTLGLGSLGANWNAGTAHTYDANATYMFHLGASSNLNLGLLSMTSYGGGFDSLKFTVTSGSTVLLQDSFTSLASAQTFFTDHPVNLGTFGAGTQTIKVDYSLVASAWKGADISYLLSARIAPAAQASSRSSIGAPTAKPASALLTGLCPPAAGATATVGVPRTHASTPARATIGEPGAPSTRGVSRPQR